MKSKALTKAEKQWLNSLQALLDECPSGRLEAYTIGDSQISVFDGSMMAQIDALLEASPGTKEFCSAVREAGADLVNVRMPFPVHSTAG